MGRSLKIILVIAIACLVLSFLFLGINAVSSMEAKIAELQNRAALIEKKKEYIMEQALSLEAIQNNLTLQIALEKDNALQEELLKNYTAMKSAAELEMQQKIAQQLAEQQAAQQAAQLAAQQAQAATVQQTSRTRQVVKKVSTPVKTSAS
jgi:hypothetical protein